MINNKRLFFLYRRDLFFKPVIITAFAVLFIGFFMPSCAHKKKPVVANKPILEAPPLYSEEGFASWYGPGFHGRKTASGERFNTKAMTAAHKSLPFGSMIKVTNLSNDKEVFLRINDRGPFVRGRIVDVSKSAAKELSMLGSGTAPVKLELMNKDFILNDNGNEVIKFLKGRTEEKNISKRKSAKGHKKTKIVTASVEKDILKSEIAPDVKGNNSSELSETKEAKSNSEIMTSKSRRSKSLNKKKPVQKKQAESDDKNEEVKNLADETEVIKSEKILASQDAPSEEKIIKEDSKELEKNTVTKKKRYKTIKKTNSDPKN
jgi:rare lipoprotein A